ncbi:DUF3696 domain-containing protein [Gammaproteobacteria bacterium]|nr:DUF3696 domain-containing protein [Gammaproteobacteria bacterium]
MKVSEITLSGFQAIGEEPATIRLDGITVLTGPNSAGKSSILDFLKHIEKDGLAAFAYMGGSGGFVLELPSEIGSHSSRFNIDVLADKLGFKGDNEKDWPHWYGKNYEPYIDLQKFVGTSGNIRVWFEEGGFSVHLDDQLLFKIGGYDSNESVNQKIIRLLLDIDEIEGMPSWYDSDFAIDDDGQDDANWVTVNPKNCESVGLSTYQFYGKEEQRKSLSKSIITSNFYKEDGETFSVFGLCHWFDEGGYGTYDGAIENAYGIEYDKNIIHDIAHSRNDKELRCFGYILNSGEDFEMLNYFTDPKKDPKFHKRYSLEFLKRSPVRRNAHNEYAAGVKSLTDDLTCFMSIIDKLIKNFVSSNFTNISGNRTIIDSNKPLAVIDGTYGRPEIIPFLVDESPYGKNLADLAIGLETLTNKKTPYFFMADKLRNNAKGFTDRLKVNFPSLGIDGFVTERKVLASMQTNKTSRGEPEVVFLYLKVKNKDGKVLNIKDVGSGVSYVLPILAGIASKNLIFIEEPELHLHPRAQCELADVFIAGASSRRSLILETHSEHMILRLLRRVREGVVPPKDINLYYFKPTKDGGTQIKQIRVSPDGEFLNTWPDGFFGEREQELFS